MHTMFPLPFLGCSRVTQGGGTLETPPDACLWTICRSPWSACQMALGLCVLPSEVWADLRCVGSCRVNYIWDAVTQLGW